MAEDLVRLPGESMPLAPGISPGLNPLDGLVWHDAVGVKFRTGRVRAGPGRELIWNSARVPNALSQTQVEGEARIYLGTTTSIQLWRNGAFETIGTVAAEDWNLEPWGSFLIANKIGGGLYAWRNKDKLAKITTPFTSAKLLTKLGPHLLVGNLDSGNTQLMWCHADDIDNWEFADPNTSAGELTLRDLDSDLVAFCPLGDAIAVYTKDAMGIASYVGFPYYIVHNPRLNGIGAVSPKSVTAAGAFNYGLGRHGIWRTDGVSFEYIDELIRDWFLDQVDWTRSSEITAFHNEVTKEIVWHYYNAVEDCWCSISFNYREQSWARDIGGYVSAIERSAFDYPIGVDKDGLVWFLAKGEDYGSPRDQWVGSRPLSFHPDMFTLINEVQTNFTGTGLFLKIFAIQDFDVPIDELDYRNLEHTPGVEVIFDEPAERFVYPEWEAAYFILMFYSTSGTANWKISSLVAKGHPGGFRSWP